ncbi:MAG: sulfatase-like hydrolase/transferase [Rubripirellula sp.]|nr:sulfatase-like hydrolase/transferase [Rubripirellula sp.]
MKSCLSIALAISLVSASANAADRPNIVFMMSDDQAWNGLSVSMHPDLEWSKSSIVDTPNLEKLAAQGMRFSAAYAPASVCSPTRVSLQTGKSSAAMHWTKAAPPEIGHKMIEPRNIRSIPASDVTIGELLQSAGYATAHYGKWHINGGGPAANGYDEGDGNLGNEHAHQYGDPNPADIFGMAERAVMFMEKNKAVDKPFFIQMSWHALHAPQNAMKETLVKYAQRMSSSVDEKRVGSAAIAENLDTGVGMVIDAIDRLGLTDNTYVIYMSDNGSGGGGGGKRGRRRAGLAGGKGGVWEGGIRSPLIIRGPGVPASSWCHERVVGYDFYPTYCVWAGLSESKLPRNIEGGSIVSLLRNGRGTVKRPRKELVFHFPHYQGGDGPHSALFLGNYKLMKFYEDNRLALFDIAADISEQNDLSQQMPQKVKELDRLLVKYLQDINAQMAVPNPQFDPNAHPAARQRGGGNRRTDPILSLSDANRDGQLSTAEINAIPGALRETDADGNGVVTLQEIQAGQTKRNRSGNAL